MNSSLTESKYSQPYPGLRPYLQTEAELFFGRADQINHMLMKLEDNRFLAVVGSSGSGKSSLVRAGLIPSLKEGYLLDAGKDWKFVIMKPGDDPLNNLATAFHKGTTDQHEALSGSDIAFTRAMLQASPLGLLKVIKEARLKQGLPLLILVDQFEEIFRFRRHSSSAVVMREERPIHEERNKANAFVNLLLTTASKAHCDELPIYVVITMRSDFIGDCEVFPDLPQAVSDSQFLVPNMSREQMKEAIEKPLMMFGCCAELSMVNKILNDAGSAPDQLPLTQHTLMRTWFAAKQRWEENQCDRVLTIDDYSSVGGIAHALSKHLEEAWEALPVEKDKEITRVLFLSLCTRTDEGKLVRRAVKVEEVARVAGVELTDVMKVVNLFQADARNFIVASPSGTLGAETVLDISHEALLRQWQRLINWLEEETISVQDYRHLVRTAARWRAGDADLMQRRELERTLDWKHQYAPTPAWAERYDPLPDSQPGTSFDLAMAFIDESSRLQQQKNAEARRKHEQEQQEKEQRTQAQIDKQRMLKRFWFFTSILLLIMTAGSSFSLYLFSRSQRQQGENLSLTFKALAKTEPAAALVSALAYLNHMENHFPLLSRGSSYSNLYLIDSIIPAVQNLSNVPFIVGERERKPAAVWSLVLSNDHQKQLITAGADGFIRRWDLEDAIVIGDEINSNQGQVLSLLSLGNGNLITGGTDGTIARWDGNGKQIRSISTNSGAVLNLVSLPSGDIVSGGSDGRLRRFDINLNEIGTPIETSKNNTVSSLVVLKNGQILAGGTDKKVRRFDKNLQLINDFDTDQQKVRALLELNSGELLTGAEDGTIRLWKSDGTSLTNESIQTNQQSVRSLIELTNGEIISAGSDGTIRRWIKHRSNNQGIRIEAKGNSIKSGQIQLTSMLDLPSGEFLTGGLDGTIRLWDFSPMPFQFTIRNDQGEVTSLAVGSSGVLFTGGKDGTINQYDKQGKLLNKIPGDRQQQNPVTSLLVLDDGDVHLVAGGANGQIRRFDRDNNLVGNPIFTAEKNNVRSLTKLNNGGFAAGGSDGIIRLYDDNGRLVDKIITNKNSDREIEILSLLQLKSNWLAAGGTDGTIRLYNIEAGPPFKPIENKISKHNAEKVSIPVVKLVEMSNGDFLSGSSDGLIQRWRKDGTPVKDSIPTEKLQMYSFVRRDSGQLITLGVGGVISHWSKDGKTLGEAIESEVGTVNHLAILNDKVLIAAGVDQIRLWPLGNDVIDWACTRLWKDKRTPPVSNQRRKMAYEYCKARETDS